MPFDLVLRGGRVIDPSQKLDAVTDIAFAAGKVVRVGNELSIDPETDVRDVSGYIVTPGLIDLHTHVYWGGTSIGIDAEEFCRTSGVTTAVDTGSAGPGNFAGFRKHVIEPSQDRILAYLHVSHAGIFGFSHRVMVGESEEIRLMNPIDAASVADLNRDLIVGIKVRVGRNSSGTSAIVPLEIALEVAEQVGMPLMAHIDHPRMVDMRHQRHADLLGDLKRNFERHDRRRARGVAAYSHLDADDEVAVEVRHAGGVDRIHQPDLLTLADHDPMREAEDAGVRDMQISEDADLARLDHVLAEAREITGAGAAGVDRRGDARGAAELLGVDADRSAAPIDMGVQIDQARSDDVTRYVAHVGFRIDTELVSDPDHLAGGEGDIRHGVELLRGVNHPTAAQDQIERHRNLLI